MANSLGIDFGTSTTKIAFRNEGQLPIPLKIGKNGELFMPSAIAYERLHDGAIRIVAIGEDALDIPVMEDIHIIKEIKRCFYNKVVTKTDKEQYPWWDVNNNCVNLWGHQLTYQEVVFNILNEAIKRVIKYNEEIDGSTIRALRIRMGCSVISNVETRLALTEVANQLRFNYHKVETIKVEDIYEEPILAAMSYFHTEELRTGEIILIYDFGGGTFDTSVIVVDLENVKGMPKFTVLSAQGAPRCGGVDIDDALYEHCIKKIADSNNSDVLSITKELTNMGTEQVLRNTVRRTKETLSNSIESNINLNTLINKNGSITITREELEDIIKKTHILEMTHKTVLRAWRLARMIYREPTECAGTYYPNFDSKTGIMGDSIFKVCNDEDIKNHVSKIILVGGPTQTPIIRNYVKDLWGKNNNIISDDTVPPIEAVSMGGAWRQESTRIIIDHLHFSIKLLYNDQTNELYKAYIKTVNYNSAKLGIYPYKSNEFQIPKSCQGLRVEFHDVNNTLIGNHVRLDEKEFSSKTIWLEIDMFGRCLIKSKNGEIMKELENPDQHKFQRDSLSSIEKEKEKEKADENLRASIELHRPSCLEND